MISFPRIWGSPNYQKKLKKKIVEKEMKKKNVLVSKLLVKFKTKNKFFTYRLEIADRRIET